jgi:hypothetical protein
MSIRLMANAEGIQTWCIGLQLHAQLCRMSPEDRYDLAWDKASTYVSENEGYNSRDFDRMVDEIMEAMLVSVEEYLDLQRLLQEKYPDRDFAHEADMAEVRKQQLEADGPYDDEESERNAEGTYDYDEPTDEELADGPAYWDES